MRKVQLRSYLSPRIAIAMILVLASLANLVEVSWAKPTSTECKAPNGDTGSCSSGTTASKQLPNDVWMNAMVSTAAISILGNIGILIFLFIDDNVHTSLALKTMVAFAVGGLLGDVFIHLLPHASTGDPHDPTGGLWVLAGIFTFFLLEKLVRMMTGFEHTHGHSHGNKNNNTQQATGIRPGAWLNMVADVTHNFVDGMAIAAAFRTSKVLGTTTTLGVLIHEIPHEMGDFAVLLAQGFSKRGAFLSQFVSALGAFAGCAFGLVINSSESQPRAVLNFTAGGFIYVALVDVLPEILGEPTSLMQLIREIIAIGAGIYIMILVAQMEKHDHDLAAHVMSITGGHTHSHSHSHSHPHHHGHSHAH